MTGPEGEERGLCPACRHVRVVSNRRGSVFLLCRRSFDDPDYPRYPPLPVARCRGFQPTGHRPGDGGPPPRDLPNP